MLMRVAPYLPTLVAALVAAWFGWDFGWLREGDSPFTWYGSLPDVVVDRTKGYLAMAGAVAMVTGLACGREFVTRIGYLLAGAAYLIFSVGFLLQALVLGENLTHASAISAATPGMTYGLLAIWMGLTAVTPWAQALDPHEPVLRRLGGRS